MNDFCIDLDFLLKIMDFNLVVWVKGLGLAFGIEMIIDLIVLLFEICIKWVLY